MTWEDEETSPIWSGLAEAVRRALRDAAQAERLHDDPVFRRELRRRPESALRRFALMAPWPRRTAAREVPAAWTLRPSERTAGKRHPVW